MDTLLAVKEVINQAIKEGLKAVFEWVRSARRYRDTTTGRFISQDTLENFQQDYLDKQADRARDLARQLVQGDLKLGEWESGMRQIIKETHLVNYAVGFGAGRQNMTQADYGKVGQVVRKQYEYLSDWASQIKMGIEGDSLETIEQAIGQRANYYLESARASYWRGVGAGVGVKLPAYPRDGSSACLFNCRCRWDIDETDKAVIAHWRLSPAEHCKDCVDRSSKWGNLRFER